MRRPGEVSARGGGLGGELAGGRRPEDGGARRRCLRLLSPVTGSRPGGGARARRLREATGRLGLGVVDAEPGAVVAADVKASDDELVGDPRRPRRGGGGWGGGGTRFVALAEERAEALIPL